MTGSRGFGRARSSRNKTILSGDSGDAIMAKESEELFWSELVRLATGS